MTIGELLDTGAGTVTIRISRDLAHPIEKVWLAITESQHLDAWFPQRVVGDLTTPGAVLRFDHPEVDAATFDGKVLACEPPHLLEFLWGVDVIRLELARRGEECTLTLSDTLEEKGKAARDGAGWHTCLDYLEASLDGRTPELTHEQIWKSVHPDYVKTFGPEAATIGPPEGMGH
jgi:uncharacterized protein YndB with AHSA1/START domain